MSRFLTILFVLIIVAGAYTGVRYLGATIHSACANPAEDCPPPFRVLGDLGWFITGGDLVPFWTRR